MLVLALLAGCGGSNHSLSVSPPHVTHPSRFATVGPPTVGITLHASNGSWSRPIQSFAYQWQDCTGVDSTGYGTGCTNVNGATSSAYTAQQSDVGFRLGVLVTATLAGGSSVSQPSFATLTVTVPAPTLTPGPGTWTSLQSFSNLGGYRLYWPSNPNPTVVNGKRGLMLVLHGCTQDISNVVNHGYNLEQAAEQYGEIMVAPEIPGTGFGVPGRFCWNWSGTSRTRTSADEAALAALAQNIAANSQYQIDPNQVYVTGLSSGGIEVSEIMCLFPDVFAGGGAVGGPSLGSPFSYGVPQSPPSIQSTCNKFASGFTQFLGTQIMSFGWNTEDEVVDPQNDVDNVAGWQLLFGTGTTATSTSTVAGGPAGNATVSEFSDASRRVRLSQINVSGQSTCPDQPHHHAWWGGAGTDCTVSQSTHQVTGNYTDPGHINYPVWLTGWFQQHNLRVATGNTTTTTTTTTPVPSGPPTCPSPGAWTSLQAFSGLAGYEVYCPSNPNPSVKNGKRALMLALHGCAQSYTNVVNQGFNWESTAEQYGMVVVAPEEPNGGANGSQGCWNWGGTTRTRNSPDDAALAALTQSIVSNSSFSIDPNQVYVSGLSAGAAETTELVCLFPDVFAGGGANATPGLGSPFGAGSSPSASSIQSVCQNYASGHTANLQNQIMSFAWNTGDTTVATSNDVNNVAGWRLIYGTGSTASGTSTIPGGPSGSGTEQEFSDSNGKVRLSQVTVSGSNPCGIPHAWLGGPGGSCSVGGTFSDNGHINYPAWLTGWLFLHNLRA